MKAYPFLTNGMLAAAGALLPWDNHAADKVPTIIIPPTIRQQQQQESKDIADAPAWALRNVTRKISTDNRVWMGFHITSKGYQDAKCYMLIHVQGDPSTTGFANQPCVGSNFSVSWGYARANDAGIMTLINPDSTRSGWFGWNHVNDKEELLDNGPNVTVESAPASSN